MAKQDEYTVTVSYTIKGRSAQDAEAKLRAKLGLPKQDKPGAKVRILGTSAVGFVKPSLSADLENYLTEEVEANDQDPNGLLTDLNYAWGSYQQQDAQIVGEAIGCQDGNEVDARYEQVGIDLEALLARYGGDTKLCDLLS